MKRSTILATLVLSFLFTVPAQADLEGGLKAYELEKYERAYRLLLPHAKKGNAKAQHAVGVMLWVGYGVTINELGAVNFLLESAKQGFTPAQLQLGSIYSNKIISAKITGTKPKFAGASKPLDPRVGIKWLLVAARKGHMQAYGALANAHCFGSGVVEDHTVAYGWWALYLGKLATNPDAWSGYSCGFDFKATRGFILTALQTAQELRRKYGLPGHDL